MCFFGVIKSGHHLKMVLIFGNWKINIACQLMASSHINEPYLFFFDRFFLVIVQWSSGHEQVKNHQDIFYGLDCGFSASLGSIRSRIFSNYEVASNYFTVIMRLSQTTDNTTHTSSKHLFHLLLSRIDTICWDEFTHQARLS